jgi:hypothetical protein
MIKRNMLKEIRFNTTLFLVLITLAYIIAFLNLPLIFIVYLPIAALILLASLLFSLTPFFLRLIAVVVKPRRSKILFICLSMCVIPILLFRLTTSTSYRYVEPSSKEVLGSLAYVSWAPLQKEAVLGEEASSGTVKSGVITHDASRAYEGLNLYNFSNTPTAYLIDMSGNILHAWSEITPDRPQWYCAKLCEDGDLLVIIDYKELVRFDWDSTVRWAKRMRAHHDIAISENGDIYCIEAKDELAFFGALPVPICNNYIIRLSPEGRVKEKIPLFDVLKEKIHFSTAAEIYRWLYSPGNLKEMFLEKQRYCFKNTTPPDVFHANAIEIINRDIDGLCEKGDLLVAFWRLDLVAILNAKDRKLAWQWGPGELDRPHNPTLLENGNILIFDNGYERSYSRLVELDPLKKTIAWEYKTDPPKKFFSRTKGASQELPNGNILITESGNGHVFEVTKDGEIVWEFYSPEINRDENKRGVICRMTRLVDVKRCPRLDALVRGARGRNISE